MGGQMDENQQGQVAAAVAAQIQAEQQLVAARLNWNLTFQGFMIASYALVATADGSAPARQFIHGTITVAGFFVAAATLAGIVASSRQSNYLKEHWLRVLGAARSIRARSPRETAPCWAAFRPGSYAGP